jgi:hypothetical protein
LRKRRTPCQGSSWGINRLTISYIAAAGEAKIGGKEGGETAKGEGTGKPAFPQLAPGPRARTYQESERVFFRRDKRPVEIGSGDIAKLVWLLGSPSPMLSNE